MRSLYYKCEPHKLESNHFPIPVYFIQLLTGDEGNIWYVGPEDKMLPEAEGRQGNILSEGPTYHMLPESPVNNCFVIPSLVKDNE